MLRRFLALPLRFFARLTERNSTPPYDLKRVRHSG
jgi:hypothetical protein